MQRKQIYLSTQHIQALAKMASGTDENMSSLIRQGIDLLIKKQEKAQKDQKKKKEGFIKALHAAAGMWKDRDDIDFETMRASNNYRFGDWNKE